MTDIVALKAVNALHWANMHMRADRVPAFHATAVRLCAPDAKPRYQGVTDRLIELKYQMVPWWFIPVVSEREYGGPPRWDRQLGQGDPLAHTSIHDPKSRGLGQQGFHSKIVREIHQFVVEVSAIQG